MTVHYNLTIYIHISGVQLMRMKSLGLINILCSVMLCKFEIIKKTTTNDPVMVQISKIVNQQSTNLV